MVVSWILYTQNNIAQFKWGNISAEQSDPLVMKKQRHVYESKLNFNKMKV